MSTTGSQLLIIEFTLNKGNDFLNIQYMNSSS